MKTFEEAEAKSFDIFKPAKEDNNKLEENSDGIHELDKCLYNFADVLYKKARS